MYDNLTRTNLEFAYREAEKRIAQLEKENAELKEEMNAKQVVLNDFKSRVETVTDRFNKKSSQLTKAKEIIKDYMIIAKGGNITVCSVLKENRSINVLKLNEEAWQFLNGVTEK